MKKILSAANEALYMEIAENTLFYTYDRMLGKLDLAGNAPAMEREALVKSGKYRQCLPVGDRLYIKAFCDLHEFSIDAFEPLRTWKLGENLSSDINVIRSDGDTIFASIRNGALAAIDIKTGDVRTRTVCDFSIWDFALTGDRLWAGNVKGELLQIDKRDFTVINKIPAHKKNLKSIVIKDGLIYTASQDLTLRIRDIETLAETGRIEACHKKMFYIAGCNQGRIVTCSPPCRETKVWDLSTLKLLQTHYFADEAMLIHGDNFLFAKRDGIYAHEI